MGNVVALRARLTKLRAMGLSEVLGRVQYRAALAAERYDHQRRGAGSPDHLGRALRRDLRGSKWQPRLLAARRATPARFFPGAHERDRMRALFATQFAPERADMLVHAAHARAHRFEFFGKEFQYSDEINWQADPVTGRQWPAKFHPDVPVHGGDVGYGDVKHVWELSRQQYLIDLAKSFYLTDATADLQAMRRLVRSWIAGNPYGTGVNWACALEPAFRAWSWLWAYHLTAGALDDEFHLEWLRGFHEHGRFLSRHLEHYSSPYNHLIGEAAALYALGVCFPEFREAGEWRRAGRSVLERRLPDQFYADGGSVEQSTFYHHATTGFYMLAALLARANGEELSRDIQAAIERGITFSQHLSQPDGRTPEIGGADDGKPVRMEHLPFWDFRPYQAIGAVMFRRPDFKMVAGRFYEDALWLTGPDGLAAFSALESRAPEQAAVLLRSSGYAVSRSSWMPTADYVCVDVGEQAAGMRPDGIPNSMHGHADCLSVIICLGGRRVLVDSGLYAYNCGGDWEAHFRETAAHNTARIDGRDQARHIGKMAWSHSYRPSVEGHLVSDRETWIVGSHDGYMRGPDGVTHRRTVWRRPGGYVVIRDDFDGAGSHDLEVNFQFAPGELRLEGSRALFDGFAELAWISRGDWRAETRHGGAGPADGWICPSLGVRQAAPRLTLQTRTSAARTSLLTVLTHGASRVVEMQEAEGLIGVVGDSWVDWIAAESVTTAPAMSTDGRLAVCRVTESGTAEQAHALGTYLRIDGPALQRLFLNLKPVLASR